MASWISPTEIGSTPAKGSSSMMKRGEVVGLLGPNGAGKTTCFYMITGLIPVDDGAIRLDGRDITALSMSDRARMGIGYLPQEPSVFRRLTVEDNLLTVLEMRKDLTKRGRTVVLEALLEELQVTHLRGQLGQSLSGGELNASAATIDYQLTEETVELRGNVVLERPQGTLRSQRVVYSVKTGRLAAGEGVTGGVQLVIPPKAPKPAEVPKEAPKAGAVAPVDASRLIRP